MSDDDDFMQDSDQEEYVKLYQTFSSQLIHYHRYDFEYEENDEEEDGDVDIENKYYNAKQMKTTDPEGAIEEFLGVPALEQEKSDWGFKGLKQAIKLEFKLGLYDKVNCLFAMTGHS